MAADRIEALLLDLQERVGSYAMVRGWVGPTPHIEPGQIPYAVAAEVSYYAPRTPSGETPEFLQIDRHRAAEILAMLATQSQAYEFNRPPPPEMVANFEEHLAVLDGGARFFTCGDPLDPHYAWSPGMPERRSGEFRLARIYLRQIALSDATFEAGVIGFDDKTAFIFWAEEED